MNEEPNFEFPALRDARAKYAEAQKRLHTIFDEAGPEMDMSKVKCISGTNTEKVEEIKRENAELPTLKRAMDDYYDLARAAANARNTAGISEKGDGGGDTEEKVTKGKFDLGAEVFKHAITKSGYQQGQGTGQVQRMDITLKSLFLRTTGWDPEDLRTGHVELTALRPAPHVVDFIPQTTTSMSDVVYMEETTFTNNAAEITEATTFGEAALALTERTSPVQKVAIWLPFTDEQVEDEPRARDYINNRLTYMLQNRLDLQVLTGSGTAPNLKGTENVAGINTQALGTDSVPDAIYKGMRVIRDTGFAEPNVVFIRPSKWEGVRLLKTSDGQYIWGHPSIPGVDTIWGVQVVQTVVPTATKALIGDYRNYAELAVRRGLDVQMTNAHSTFFIEGKQAIRMDLRCALIHYRPSAFTAVTGL